MVVENAVDRHAVVATNKSRTRGIIDMPTSIPDPRQAGGSKGSSGNRQGKAATDFWYCPWKGYGENEC